MDSAKDRISPIRTRVFRVQWCWSSSDRFGRHRCANVCDGEHDSDVGSWPGSALPGPTPHHTSVCSAISSASSTSMPYAALSRPVSSTHERPRVLSSTGTAKFRCLHKAGSCKLLSAPVPGGHCLTVRGRRRWTAPGAVNRPRLSLDCLGSSATTITCGAQTLGTSVALPALRGLRFGPLRIRARPNASHPDAHGTCRSSAA